MWPRGIHHSAVYASFIGSNHWRRRRSTAMCAGPYTYAPSASTDSQTDMLIRMPPSAPSASCSKARIAVAFPSSVCSRHTNPGAASATAFTESSAATKPAIRRLSSGASQPPDVHLRQHVVHPLIVAHFPPGYSEYGPC